MLVAGARVGLAQALSVPGLWAQYLTIRLSRVKFFISPDELPAALSRDNKHTAGIPIRHLLGPVHGPVVNLIDRLDNIIPYQIYERTVKLSILIQLHCRN